MWDYEKILLLIVSIFLVSFVSIAAAQGLTVSISDTTGKNGSVKEVPIQLEEANDVGSMDVRLSYNPEVLQAVTVEPGELGENAFMESNTANEGEIVIALADSSGINGDGEVALISFQVIGDTGESSPVSLEEVSVYNTELVEVATTTEDGTFTVTEGTGTGTSESTGCNHAILLTIAAIVISMLIIKKRK